MSPTSLTLASSAVPIDGVYFNPSNPEEHSILKRFHRRRMADGK
jgi:hypothetical protein